MRNFKKGDHLVCLEIDKHFDLHVGGFYIAADDSYYEDDTHGEDEWVELTYNDSGEPFTCWYAWQFAKVLK